MMDSNSKARVASQAHPETMDFLSSAWCDFAVQALQPADDPHHHSLLLVQNNLDLIPNLPPFTKLDKSMKMEDAETRSIPPWKANDVKSWIWMQQAMHPELNYSRKKWLPWKMVSFKTVSIKKWLKELKLKRKEEGRLQRAQVHAAISVAGVAAALAAVAAENKADSRDAAVASAAALVASECAQMAESLGANRKELHSALTSAISATQTTDIFTLTAAASTSLKGAATLKARKGYKSKSPLLPIQDNNADIDFNFEKCRSLLARGAELGVEMPDGKYKHRAVSVILNREAKVILRTRSFNMLKNKKKSVVMEVHAELYEGEPGTGNAETCYMIVLTTNCGTIKVDMEDDYQLYKTWANTITHMLMHSTSLAKYQLQFYNN